MLGARFVAQRARACALDMDERLELMACLVHLLDGVHTAPAVKASALDASEALMASGGSEVIRLFAKALSVSTPEGYVQRMLPLVDSLGSPHRELRMCAAVLASLCWRKHQDAPAIPLCQDSCKHLRRLLADQDTRVATAAANIIGYASLQSSRAAVQLYPTRLRLLDLLLWRGCSTWPMRKAASLALGALMAGYADAKRRADNLAALLLPSEQQVRQEVPLAEEKAQDPCRCGAALHDVLLMPCKCFVCSSCSERMQEAAVAACPRCRSAVDRHIKVRRI